ncbi:19258_t:CDS:2, partial [Racocetra fulgida]
AQPVSFTYNHLRELENENIYLCSITAHMTLIYKFSYFVCEKSDGIRVLLYLTVDSRTGQPCVYLIDRKNNYHQLFDLLFPVPGDDKQFHDGTLVDSELIVDVEEDGMVEVKPMELSYGLDKVWNETIPKLKHKSDGLIFTSSVSPYIPGTCEKMSGFNYQNRPKRFLLYKWMQKDEYSYFDDLYVTDEEWDEWQRNEEPLENRIVEVTCETLKDNTTRWRFLRFRDDKPHGNHYTVVEKIQESIMDGI